MRLRCAIILVVGGVSFGRVWCLVSSKSLVLWINFLFLAHRIQLLKLAPLAQAQITSAHPWLGELA
jgi:hypothetical protein